MANPRSGFWVATGAVALAIAMAALLVFELAQLRSIQQSSNLRTDSFTSMVFQFDREFSSLREELERNSKSGVPVDVDNLTLRYELFLSRLTLMHDNPSIAIFMGETDYLLTMPKVDQLVQRMDVVMQNPSPEQPALSLLAEQFRLLGPDVRALSMSANREASLLMERQDRIMLNQNRLIVGLTVAQLLLLVMVAVALMSRQKRQDADRKMVERELEDRVDQRTTELLASNHALESTLTDLRTAQTQLVQSEKMASLGQLVASVAHEINTPIGAMKASGKNIADALDFALVNVSTVLQMLDQASCTLFIQLVRNSSSKAAVLTTREERAITRDLTRQLEDAGVDNARHKAGILVQLHANQAALDYLPLLQHAQNEFIFETVSKIATIASSTENINIAVDRVGKIVFALKSFSRVDHVGEFVEADLREGIETVLTIYQSEIRQGTELVTDFEAVPLVRCLPDQLNQVWTNLVHNALQAMKHTGTLTIRVRQTNGEVVVSVGDTGCGIPEAIRGKIFEAFFTTKPAGEGSGLGLDIVKKIVDKHHGRIEVQSEVGVGSTFSVYLPLQAPV